VQPYEHLTLEERESLQGYLLEGNTQAQIAKALNRSPSTISRELRRNSNKDGRYTPLIATNRYIHRRKNSRRELRVVKDECLLAFIAQGLKDRWPPEAIVAKWKLQHPGVKLSVSTVYQSLKRGLIKGYSAKTHLQRRGKRKYQRGITATIRPDKTIDERCEEANLRLRIGDWEGDTIVGRDRKNCVITCVDRKSRYILAQRSTTKNAEVIYQKLVEMFHGVPIKTLTLDNGSEFAQFRKLQRALNIDIYFAHPRSPWERGTNENMNGKLRYFFPKGTDFAKVSDEELRAALELLNNRPRKCLNWLSPTDLFFPSRCT